MAHDLTEQDALDLIALGCALEGVPHLAPLSALAVDPYGEDCDSAPGLPVLRCEGDCGRVLVLGGRCPLCQDHPRPGRWTPEGQALNILERVARPVDAVDVAERMSFTNVRASGLLERLFESGFARKTAPGLYEAAS